MAWRSDGVESQISSRELDRWQSTVAPKANFTRISVSRINNHFNREIL